MMVSANVLDLRSLDQVFEEEQLYEAIEAVVANVVESVFSSNRYVEELVQDILLEVWCKRDRFEADQGNVFQWVSTIARRRAIDHLRSEKRRLLDFEPLSESDEAEEWTIADGTTLTLERRRLLNALGELDDAHVRPLFLAFFVGYPYTEVATILQLPEGTVKRQIRDGLRKLRAILDLS